MIDQPEDPEQSHSNDFTSDLIGSSDYDFPTLKKKEFLPWHKPRKQFVRKIQWANQIIDLIKEIKPETGLIKYLGLPGDDFLDLRHFHEKICTPHKLKLKFLGFNKGFKHGAAQGAQMEVSLDEVNRLPNVDKTSELINDDFTSIGLNKSLAWQKSLGMGPFDVINIDLCDGFAKQSLDDFKETHYNTLSRLMTLQARRPKSWLLLITTRTDTIGVDEGVFKRLKEVFLQNLENCAIFENASRYSFDVDSQEGLELYCAESKGFSNIFLTSLCKWILKIGLDQRPQAKVAVQNVFGYTVAKESLSPDLISIAIKVTPTFETGSDSVGLANKPNILLDECELAARMLVKVHKQKDVDEILSNAPKLMNEMIKETAELLQQARYDVSHYEAWVNNGYS
jgi:hypothetical protein